ncbi:hypothetical protein R6Q57_008558 [Mikania cordata]
MQGLRRGSSVIKQFSVPQIRKKVLNSLSAVEDTFLSTKDTFERHKVVFTILTSIASVGTAWAGYTLRHLHETKVEQRLESIENAMKKNYDIEGKDFRKLVGTDNSNAAACVATAGVSLIVGYGLGWRGGRWYANRKFKRDHMKLSGQVKQKKWQLKFLKRPMIQLKSDPSLLTALKSQIQIGGTPPVNTFQATFQYQMAYRVQNHSLDIMVPGQENFGDVLLLDIDSNATPTCTYVQKWVTNYEQIYQTPVQTTTLEFFRHQNGLVEVKFSPQDKQDIFPTINMIQPLEDPRPIQHCSYDVYNYDECLEEAYKVEYDEDLPKKKKGSQNKLKKIFENGDPNVGLLGEPSEKFDYYVFSTTAAEATLNWQSENAVAQNQVLKAILIQQKNLSKNPEAIAGRLHTVENIINDVRSKIQELGYELLQMVRSTEVSHASNALTNKEAEMKFLKAQLVDLERQHKQQRRSTINDDPWRLPTTPFVKPAFDPQPLPLQSFPKPSLSLTLWASEQDKLKTQSSFSVSQSNQYCFHKRSSIGSNSKREFFFPDQMQNKNSRLMIPQSKLRERSIEMLTWCSSELQFYDIDMVIKIFLTRCQERLRDWHLSLGEYRQL